MGIVAGTLSGLIGLGGGIIILPCLIFFFGLSQHAAQGTTLAVLVPPIGILAAWTYYKNGYVDLKMAALICAGFILGGLFGARLAVNISGQTLRIISGISFVLIGLKLIFQR